MAEESNVNRNTISRLANSDENHPSMRNAKKIIKTLQKEGYNVDYDDFWDY